MTLCAPPSDDHAYCVTEEVLRQSGLSPESSIDDEYEFGNNERCVFVIRALDLEKIAPIIKCVLSHIIRN